LVIARAALDPWLYTYNYHRVHTALGATYPPAASPISQGRTP